MKQLLNHTILFALFGMLITSCSEDPAEPASFSVHGTVTFTDIEYWRETQVISFGLFAPGQKHPTYSTDLVKPAGTDVSFSLSGVSEDNYEAKLFIKELDVHSYDLYNLGSISVTEDITLNSAELQLVTYPRIQKQVFASCVACHGGASGLPAGNLNFMEGESYNQLVGATSTQSDGLRVVPFKPDSSFLIQVINEENLSFEHSSSTTVSEGELDLLLDWINTGASND